MWGGDLLVSHPGPILKKEFLECDKGSYIQIDG